MARWHDMIYGGGLKRYGSNTLWMAAEKFCRLLVMFFVGIYVANKLGPENMGGFSYALSVVMLVGVLVDFGMDGVIVRELVRTPERQGVILGSAFRLKLLGYAVMVLFIGIFIGIKGLSYINGVIIILTLGYGFHTLWAVEGLFKAKVCASYLSISQIIAMLMFALLRIIVVKNSDNLYLLASCEIVQEAVMVAGFLYFYRHGKLPRLKWQWQSDTAKHLLKESWPLAAAAAATQIYMRTDQLFITKIVGESANGCFSVAARFVEAGYFIPLVICSSVFPAIVSVHGVDKPLYNFRIRALFSSLIWCGMLMATGMIMLSPWLINTLLPKYQSSIQIIQIMSLNMIIVYFGVARGYWLLAEGLQRYNLLFMGCGVAVSLVMNSLLVPHWGIYGAAWTAIATQIAVNLLSPLLIPATRKSTVMFFQAIIGYGLKK